MEIHIEEARHIRRASASLRDGGVIHVKVPRHWPQAYRHEVTLELVERLQRRDAQEKALLERHAHLQTTITLHNQAELEAYVHRINAETFNIPLGKVRIGHSRYSHLAQVNLKTKTMSVSRYCLTQAPADALRYLIVHELAHYFESGHGPRFWALVAQHVPNYRLQSRIIKAFHHQAVIYSPPNDDSQASGSTDTPQVTTPLPSTPIQPASSSHNRGQGLWNTIRQLGLFGPAAAIQTDIRNT